MNFDEAIRSHTFWKVTLRWLVNGQKRLDEQALGDDHACELGRWIISEAAAFEPYPAFADLRREHGEFHRLAGDVARLVSAGQLDAANGLLAPDGAFTRASERTIAALKALRDEAQ